MWSKKPALLLLVLLAPLPFGACGNQQEKKSENNTTDTIPVGRDISITDTLQFVRPSGKIISELKVAVADEQMERNEGLMDVINLPSDEGMLFIFPKEEPLSFWMANTPLSLDIFFVNADSTIIRVHQNTTPFSDEQILSEGPAKYVVETNAGYAIANDIQEGVKIRF